jgi:ATPase subunit of ABC transporter with duplicated ATPase domains
MPGAGGTSNQFRGRLADRRHRSVLLPLTDKAKEPDNRVRFTAISAIKAISAGMSGREVFRKIIGIDPEKCFTGPMPAYPGHQKMLDISHNVILYLEDISVSFDGFKALNKLSLTIDADELRCIIGPNGADKTTMMHVITGKTRPDSGTTFFGQTTDLTRLSEPEIAHAGIGRKF